MDSKKIVFIHDDDIEIQLIDHKFSGEFRGRLHYEPMFRKIHTFLIKKGVIKNNIIDLGAYIGDNTLPWAKMLLPKGGIIYAIDPSNENCEFIQGMCKENDLSNVKIFQTAVSDSNETLTTNGDLHHCSFVFDDNYNKIGENGKLKVVSTTLDSLFESTEIENIGYIHLDVEGMEYKVLKGALKILKTFQPIITYEQHLNMDDIQEIPIFLKEWTRHDYQIFLINEIMPNCRFDCRNFIVFPKRVLIDYENLVEEIHKFIGFSILTPFS